MKTARVFPRRTRATPDDALAFIGSPDLFSGGMDIDRVKISVTFTWDLPEAERLYKEWARIAPAETGGPALGQRGEEFTPGLFLKKGYVITSRGCPNRCWFCSVWRREGAVIRELPVTDGWNVLDDNILACSENHIRAVFAMLKKQKRRPHFTGGLEPARLMPWHVRELASLKPKQLFFAYDGPEDREPLFEAGKLLSAGGFTRRSQSLRCYVLIGYPKDTMEAAEARLNETMRAGFMPFAMLYRDQGGKREPAWIKFARPWQRLAAVSAQYRSME